MYLKYLFLVLALLGVCMASTEVEAQEAAAVGALMKFGGFVVQFAGGVSSVFGALDAVRSHSSTPSKELTASELNDRGLAYMLGRAGYEIDYLKAQQDFENAIQKGSIVAKLNLGVLYESGQIAKLEGRSFDNNDLKRATDYFFQNWQFNHNRVAAYDIGTAAERYREMEHAVGWYKLASDRGYGDADTALDRICWRVQWRVQWEKCITSASTEDIIKALATPR